MAILRAVGARPGFIFSLFLLEAMFVGTAACIAGVVTVYGGLWLAGDLIQARAGVSIPVSAPGAGEFIILSGVLLSVLIAACLPAWRAFRLSLSDGLNVRA